VTGLRLPGLDVPVTGRLLRLGVADDDRAAVVADVLRRVAELGRLRVHVFRDGGDRLHLNVPAAQSLPRGPVDVAVGALRVEACHSVPTPEWDAPPDPAGDPLAARLLILDTPLQAPVAEERLAAAATELSQWRRRVARWATTPSGALPAEAEGVRAAVSDGLDTPRALQHLRALVGNDGLLPGSRFEAMLALDRILGLDLASGLGQQ
jgi:hypothetical protein